MRKIALLLSSLVISAVAATAQTVSTFDTLSLPGTDTCYINYAHPGVDVGFNDGLAYFPCVYDTSFGGIWSEGFAYSNKNDTVTSGFTNEYSAKCGTGFGGNGKYVVANAFGGVRVKLSGIARGNSVDGLYVTNSTYAFNSMRDGDFVGKKFGDTTGTGLTTGQGTAPDWFKLTVKGYSGGSLKADSVEFYLADFRPAGTANDSIIKGWHWVNLLPLGHVDSLQFSLSSSDNGSYGMNTPAYFCMDNFTTNETSVGISNIQTSQIHVFPNPTTDQLTVVLGGGSAAGIQMRDIYGKVVFSETTELQQITINTASLAPGLYLLTVATENGTTTTRIIKQ